MVSTRTTSRHMLVFLLVCFLMPALGAAHNPLLPRPERVKHGAGKLPLQDIAIRFAISPSAEDRFAAEELAAALSVFAKVPIATGQAEPSGPAILLNRTGEGEPVAPPEERPGSDSRESYSLKVTPTGAEIRGRSSAGLYYGVQTLRQLVEGTGAHAFLPEVEIQDWPSLAYRGFMMDLAHGPLPTEAEIKRQIDFLARWKGNQYYFYSETNIELQGYPLVGFGARYRQDEVRRIVAYGRQRHVDVVPCLELYGHLHDFFKIERYARLAPIPHGSEFDPRNPAVQKILSDWIDQLANLFPSPWMHIGFDEPWEINKTGEARNVDPFQLYLDQLLNVSGLVARHGKRVIFWTEFETSADIFGKHPEAVSKLPPGIVPVPWAYGADEDFPSFILPIASKGVPFMVAPGVPYWYDVFPNFPRSFTNIDRFLAEGRKRGGVIGVINTCWTDDGQSIYRMAWPGIAYGAIASWQSKPPERPSFFSDYARQFYSPAVAAEVAPALEELARSRDFVEAAVGGQTMYRFWDDPLEPDRLERSEAHAEDLRNARLQAEDAQERLLRALAIQSDAFAVPELLLGARLLDYLGMKNIYASEIAGYFRKLGPNPTDTQAGLYLDTETSSQNHSRIADLLDETSELREAYRKAWLEEYRPYRLGTVLGRWDAEFEYWRQLQLRVNKAADEYWKKLQEPGSDKDKTKVPTLESLRPRN